MADLSSETEPAMAMNLLFLMSFSKVILSLIVMNSPEFLLLLLAIVVVLNLAMAKSEA
ncbi:hypothetical protein A2U01_0103381 [Trifolium medium]|uniref:Uncharacterized protein n=1 Tax=Trifolium medium TaxID=97028 RepID=A0A392V1W0_9FABA|nr:hypothetical protein [Trifolium medium]